MDNDKNNKENKISSHVFDKLRSKFSNITLGDIEAQATVDPEEAKFFNFDYTIEGENFGNVTISIIDDTMKIYYSQNITNELTSEELRLWYDFLKDMRKLAMSNMLRFDAHDISKSRLNINNIKATAERANVGEGKMYGSSKSSYQKEGNTKIIVRHSDKVDAEKRGARSRKIESVFVETADGERFKMPFKSLPGTRAMANHIRAGGKPYDELGESISTMVSELAQLRPFVARTRNAVYEDETTTKMVEAAKEYYQESRKTLHKLKGKRGYKAYAESFKPVEECGEFDSDGMKDRFTSKNFSDKMEAAMPVVHKAYKMKENIIDEENDPHLIKSFESWADEITEMGPITRDDFNDFDLANIQKIIDGQMEIDDDPNLWEKLYNYYSDTGEMPYKIATGDGPGPDLFEWIYQRLANDFGTLEEGTWAVADTPSQISDIKELLDGPLLAGVHGENAKGALYDILGDDELFINIEELAEKYGPEYDVRQAVAEWISANDMKLAHELNLHGEYDNPSARDFPRESEMEESIDLNRLAAVTKAQTKRGLKNPFGKKKKASTTSFSSPKVQNKMKAQTDAGLDDPFGMATESASRSIRSASNKSHKKHEAAIKKAKAWMKRTGKDAEAARKEFDLFPKDLTENKATYSDYKAASFSGDAETMVAQLTSEGKQADLKTAKNMLRKMAETKNPDGLQVNEGLKTLIRNAGIIK